MLTNMENLLMNIEELLNPALSQLFLIILLFFIIISGKTLINPTEKGCL